MPRKFFLVFVSNPVLSDVPIHMIPMLFLCLESCSAGCTLSWEISIQSAYHNSCRTLSSEGSHLSPIECSASDVCFVGGEINPGCWFTNKFNPSKKELIKVKSEVTRCCLDIIVCADRGTAGFDFDMTTLPPSTGTQKDGVTGIIPVFTWVPWTEYGAVPNGIVTGLMG